MTAILKHEVKSYFHSLTAYVFGAFFLLFIGVGSMLYNLQQAVANFEYVLSFACMIFVVIVPVLTMRTIAEERRQKTDQLLYSLPVTTTQIIVGKYLSLLLVYLLPLLVVCAYPLIFAQFGDVYLPTAYASLFAFFFLGGALIAVGIFISSLTDNQGFAAGIGIAAILFNYYSVSLAEYVSSTAIGSLIVLLVVCVIFGIVVRRLTKNGLLGYTAAIASCVVCLAVYLIDSTKLEGFIPNVMKKLSLFEQFYTIVNGVFDLTVIVFYVTVILFFLFLSVQSMEKRRYN